MKLKLRTLFAVAVIVAVAVLALSFFSRGFKCLAGGGGSTHVRPASVEFQKPVNLDLELSRWSAPECLSGKMSEHYSEVKCNYKTREEKTFASVPMRLIRFTSVRFLRL